MNARPTPFGAALLLPFLFAACGRGEPQRPAGPTLPPPQLQPFLPVLKQLAAAMPKPADDVQKELADLAEISLGTVSTDDRIKARAERSLLENQDAWFVLEPALTNDDPAIRRRAAWLCGRTGLAILQLPLLLRLKYENDPEAVVWVADSLQRLGNDTGLAWLGAAMGAAATADTAGQLAIEICRERGIALTDSPTWADLQRAMADLTTKWTASGVGSRPDVAPPSGAQLDARLATHLATTEGTALRPIDDARYVLTRCGRLALPLLTRTLGASEYYLRTMALQVLAEIGPVAAEAGPEVKKLLADPLTAAYAVRTLGEVGEQSAVPYLRPLLQSIDLELRAAAPQALGLLGDEPSRAEMSARMQDPGETMDVRVAAAFGLCCLGNAAAAKAFLDERAQQADYHAPTLSRLRDRLTQLGK